MRRGTRDGFTLIEALVAFAIVAAATLVVQRSLVQSRYAVGLATERAAPEWLVQSLLAEPVSDSDMREGGRTGVESGRRFEIRLMPLVGLDDDRSLRSPNLTLDQADRQVRWQPMRVSISVQADQSRWLTVETIKLGRVVGVKPAEAK